MDRLKGKVAVITGSSSSCLCRRISGTSSPPYFAPPLVKRHVRDPVPPAYLRYLCAGLRLAQNPEDMHFRESTPFHACLPSDRH
jgi:hypothetical protein